MKAGIIINDEHFDVISKDIFIKSLERHFDLLYGNRFRKIYVITPYKHRHNIVRDIVKKIDEYDLEIVFRELYGDGLGGGLVSLSIFMKRGEKILVIDPYFKYPDYIYQYFSVITDKARYPLLFLSTGKGDFYASLYRDKITYITKKTIKRYVFAGAAIYTYPFFSRIKEYLLIYPDLHLRELNDILNIYISRGGVIKAKFLSPSEWMTII